LEEAEQTFQTLFADPSNRLPAYYQLTAIVFVRAMFRQDEPAYDRCFCTLWGGSLPGEAASVDRSASAHGEPGAAGAAAASSTVLERLHRAGTSQEGRERHDPEVAGASYSPDERLSQRSFERMDERDLRRVDRVFDRILLRLATRKSRRYRPHRHKGRLDLRRSFRDASRPVATGMSRVSCFPRA
ncbi:MAG: hypothetical protein P8Y07_05225, partial [Gemmatimonadales bacterium]